MEDSVQALREFGKGNDAVADAALARLVSMVEASGASRGAALDGARWSPRAEERLQRTVAFASCGGFEAVVGIMNHRVREEAVQAVCCRALVSWAEGELGCQRAADAGVFSALAAALSNHATDVHVLRWGAISVLRLTYGSAVRAQMAIKQGVEERLRCACPDAHGLPLTLAYHLGLSSSL